MEKKHNTFILVHLCPIAFWGEKEHLFSIKMELTQIKIILILKLKRCRSKGFSTVSNKVLL